MSDITLKIYSSNVAWADTLDHEISGEIKDYEIVDNSNFLIDSAWFLINNSAHQYEDDITVDDGSTTQVWRAHAMDGSLINSGVITGVKKRGGNLLVRGKGMSELLRRKIIEDESFFSKDGAANAMHGKYILTDSTYGLIPKYLGSTYGSIDVTTYVDTPLTTQTLQNKIDGITLWDACILVAKASYGRAGQATDNVYDTHLFETYSGGAYSLNFWFREREVYPTSGIKRFGPADIYLPDLEYSPSALGQYNKVKVVGAFNPAATYPKDIDTFDTDLFIDLSAFAHDGGNGKTTYVEDSTGDFVNLGVIIGMYLSNITDGSWGKITAVTATRITCSAGFRDGTDKWFDNGDEFQAGYGYIGVDTGGIAATLTYDTGLPHSGTRAVSLERGATSEVVLYVLSNIGDNVDTKYHTLNFMAIARHAENFDDQLSFMIFLGVKDKYGNKNDSGKDIGRDEVWQCPFIQKHIRGLASGTPAGMIYMPFSIPLPSPHNDNGWEGVSGSYEFHTSDIKMNEWDRIYQVAFRLKSGGSGDITFLGVDYLHFVGNVPFSDTATDGTPTYPKEYIYTDRGLHSDDICENMAKQLLRGFKNIQYPAAISLLGCNRDFSLKTGENLELQILDQNINVISGQTPPKLPIQSIIHTPGKQRIKLGRHISLSEIINDAKRNIKGIDKTP